MEMMMALKKLAQLHAASAVYFENNGAYDAKFARGIYNDGMKDIFDATYESNVNEFILKKVLIMWPELEKSLLDKMVKLACQLYRLA